MPKNKVSDPITDQEIAFARLVLSGTMTDRRAAEAVGINPDSAAYTKSKPHVRAYMREHRAAVQQQLAQQEADGQHRLNLDREQVLARLWEIANLSPETTRGSITGQVKALAMIVAMQNFIPNRHADLTEKNPSPRHPTANLCLRLAKEAAGNNYRTPARPHPSTARRLAGRARARARSPPGRHASGPRPQSLYLRQRLQPCATTAAGALCSHPQFCSRRENSLLGKQVSLYSPPLSYQSAKGWKNMKFYK